MLRVTQAELSRYRREVDAQADKARDYFRRAIAEFMRRYPDATTEDTRVFVLDLMGSALPNFTDLTATLACDLFDELAEEVGFEGERARLYETTDWQMVDRKVHYLAGFLNEGDRERFKREVSDLTHYYCKRAAYDNMVANCRGQRVKWARVPTGLETCAFCFMLASRGFAYLSEKSAAEGHHGYHDNCDCVVVPGFEGPDGNPRVKVDGYDPEAMYRNWLSCAKTVGIDKHADPMSGVWTDDERRAVRREVATRDWHWLYTGEAPKWGRDWPAKPSGSEQNTAEHLAKHGYASLFRPTRSKEKKTTSDVYFVSGDSKVPWEFKRPSGNGKSTVGNQFDEAAGQSKNLVLDARDLGPYWTESQLLKEVVQKLNRATGFKVRRGQHVGERWFYDQVLIIKPDGSVQKIKRG
ncbi:hypothetical protein [Bifidobacterium sp.]|uniref:VG15 protein n=1 Tax=Bifidobacterium sp. TaxID=41200 RepID=UPI0038634D63